MAGSVAILACDKSLEEPVHRHHAELIAVAMRADFGRPTKVPLVAIRCVREKILMARDAGHLLVEHHAVRPLEVTVSCAILSNENGQIVTFGATPVAPICNRQRWENWFR